MLVDFSLKLRYLCPMDTFFDFFFKNEANSCSDPCGFFPFNLSLLFDQIFFLFLVLTSMLNTSFFFSQSQIFFISLKHNIIIRKCKNENLYFCIWSYRFKGTFYVIYMYHALKYLPTLCIQYYWVLNGSLEIAHYTSYFKGNFDPSST